MTTTPTTLTKIIQASEGNATDERDLRAVCIPKPTPSTVDTEIVVHYATENDGVRTLLTPAGLRAYDLVHDQVEAGVINWSEIWDGLTFSLDHIATFRSVANPGVTGSFADYYSIIDAVKAAGGSVRDIERTVTVPQGNQFPEDRDPSLRGFCRAIGLSWDKIINSPEPPRALIGPDATSHSWGVVS